MAANIRKPTITFLPTLLIWGFCFRSSAFLADNNGTATVDSVPQKGQLHFTVIPSSA
ncbi:hypothetical protein [Prevotella intermedia]|uniref:hypothetical protein n=1 Tax=Prevotella intermedia TaxID=28131 RepID=UPI0012FE244A|nr:hypothetical protein [Prevotella intermedia]